MARQKLDHWHGLPPGDRCEERLPPRGPAIDRCVAVVDPIQPANPRDDAERQLVGQRLRDIHLDSLPERRRDRRASEGSSPLRPSTPRLLITTASASACSGVPSQMASTAWSMLDGVERLAPGFELTHALCTYAHIASRSFDRRIALPPRIRLTCPWLAPTALAITSCVNPLLFARRAALSASAIGSTGTMAAIMHICIVATSLRVIQGSNLRLRALRTTRLIASFVLGSRSRAPHLAFNSGSAWQSAPTVSEYPG